MTMDPPAAPDATITWTWRCDDPGGHPLDLAMTAPAIVPPGFPAQADAESWVGEHWAALLGAGVDSVTLQVDGVAVYGPMSLHPAAD